MSRPFLILVAALLVCQNLTAKTKKELAFTVIHTDSVVGYTASKEPIRGNCYQFSAPIFQISMNADQNQALILLKQIDPKWGVYGRGELSAFNFQTGNFGWHFTVKGIDIRRSKDAIYCKQGTTASLFSMADGSEIRKVPGPYLFMDYENNIGFGGEYGVDLISGKCIWRHPVTAEDGELPGELYHIDDSLVAFCYGGLHVMNLYTGKGWDYKLSTTKGNPGTTWTLIGAGMVGGLYQGMAVAPVSMGPGSPRLTGFNSNIASDNGLIYIADKLGLLCWDVKTGELIWRQKISRSKMSGSEIFIKNGAIYIINKGLADQGSIGTPFIAAYDKNSGNEAFFQTLGTGGIMSYRIENDTCWIYNGDLHRVDLNTGELKSQHFIANKYVTAKRLFVDPSTLLVENIKGLTSAGTVFHGDFFMVTENNEICVFSRNAELRQVLKSNNLWLVNGRYKDNYILLNGKGETALERDGKITLKLPSGFHDNLIGDKLYRISDKSVQVISLSDVFAD
ncbi:outer membrane protein assembly factor BamB family protein [Taibaiella soli]|uniref:Pyrrolo-quinoline quinone repeat domain-containing protein n=1 Tax=Taibaiella soli TaxID=1649169 RepID=A0A2W2ABK1_9BACT|nr:PQQ-binding-like beta-propeller repeat protein [Taibaiella soli]PZF72795.1 hypothetical protein DN068_10280 [Taibaiella soli]